MSTKTRIVVLGLIAAVGIALWFAASTSTPPPSGDQSDPKDNQEFNITDANVETISIAILESFPVQVRVMASGNHPDGCTEIHETSVERTENTFNVSITAKRPEDAICTQALVPFEESISLPVDGLSKGVYTVNVNGVTDTFELQSDNALEE